MYIINNKDPKTLTAGFTLMELLIAICLMAILFAIAIPAFSDWQQSVKIKQTTDGILSALRTARHNAATVNLQNRVECNTAGNRYRITQGDRAYNSTEPWPTVKQDWTTLPAGIVLKTGDCTSSNDLNIAFSPNGTANTGTICINDSVSNKYQVVVTASGRIRSLKP